MKQTLVRESGWSRVSIFIGVAGFLLALTVSAVLVPELRLLHLLQAVIYVAVLLLTLQNNPWGFGAGVVISSAWNCLNLFVTHLFQVGAGQLWSFVHTGHMSQPVPFMVMVGGVSHFLLLIACMAAFLHLRPSGKQWGQFAAGGILVLAYMSVIIATTAPH